MLYAIAVGATGSAAGVVVFPPPAPLLLGCAIGSLASLAAFRWISANRVALDGLAWCVCAPTTVRVRVIAPRVASTPLAPLELGSVAWNV